ncbi:chemotaxis protein CheW [Tranquillimonas alkanivorans]|uniref:Purine-binding chemotaxis protein CheW n=1 Tax=Tranquillimonas alkanivorans TaxID=441119 RepID=A0A1I5SAC8_9RHOB|nr:chemotaxis protein CheW [Tranquillimonas alkanivorans]SFP67748.1 purine-binding chemotaxis protein CheW [Tranquillimonas alkanivorans]
MHDRDMRTNSTHREFVAFRTAQQDFCVDIISIREIRGWTSTTSLPHAPSYVRGVINLRGSVVPIVDLAARLGLGALDDSERNVIVIAIIGNQVVGLLVEAVFDILTVAEESIQGTPAIASESARDYVKGIITEDDRMIRRIDLERILPPAMGDVA